MNTVIYSRDDVDEIVGVLKNGGMVAIPTDTVYGLAISSKEERLYSKLKNTKGRPDSKPFPLMVSNLEQLEDLVELNDVQRYLVKTFMPGPVTFIFRKKEGVFPYIGNTLGIRMADDAWVISLLDRVGAVWLPSANLSGEKTGVSSDEVLLQLTGLIDGVVAGESLNKTSSSVFDISGDGVVELRKGVVSLEEIMKEYNKCV